MENYNLFDISTPKQWKTISSKNLKEDGEYPVYGANGIIGYYDKYNHEEETVLITCRGATCGSVNLSKPFSYINGNAMAIDNVDNSKINTKYLFYFFKQYNFNNVITGTAQPQITRTSLKNVTVIIPDLQTQNKIVALLDRANALVKQRLESIDLLNELLRARFLEMFGDLVIENYEKFKQLSEIASITSGITKGRKTKQEIIANIPYLRVANAQDGYFNLEEIKTINVTKNEIERYSLHKLDILITEGGDPDKLGRGAVWEEANSNFIFQNHLYRIRINDLEEYSAFWLSYLISSYYGKYYFLKEAKQTSGIATVNKTQVSKFPVPNIPTTKQFEFESFYHKIQTQKESLNQSKTELEQLYNSLLQRAFSGQLNFNVDIELDALLAAIDIEQDTDKEKHDIKEIATVYAGRLLERIEEQEFENQIQYQQAKQVLFQMLGEGIVEQAYDEEAEAVKLKLV
ncbi:restriction endonuclease subunit S [Leeuwenhoekiella aestuarii]|nr:restriction endonuclease subunit S [Leeuwenhoekiella aestuarii]